MKKVMLGNIDYETHMTDEGNQLQRGMQHAGWHLSGVGFDGMRNVPVILAEHLPDIVFVHDKRDWDMGSGGCFRPGINYEELHALKDSPAFRLGVVKDAGTLVEYHRRFIEQINADAVVTYYHDDTTKRLSPWLIAYQTIRTYHSVDADVCKTAMFNGRGTIRHGAIVSGAVSGCYPLRQKVMTNATAIGCDIIRHPGYNNKGSHTPNYLRTIGTYKVSIATASAYNFALRKIIEAVAMGAVPITDLPEWDCLPEIDGALVRVSPLIGVADLRAVVAEHVAKWNWEERYEWAQKAWAFYDWRMMGLRLDQLISVAALEKKQS